MSTSLKEFDAKKILTTIAKNEGFIKYDFEISDSIAPGRFVTVLLYATIKGIKQDNSNATLKVVFKRPPQEEAVRNGLKNAITYQNESVLFTTLFPALRKLQDSVRMDLSDRFNVPRILKASNDDHNEFIAMEDMSVAGFGKLQKIKTLDYNHLRLLIKKIANFHGTAFAFKTFEGKIYNDFVKSISEDLYYSLKGNRVLDLVPMVREALKYASTFTNQPEEVEALNKVLNGLPERMDYLTSRRAAEPYDVLCHGDFWKSNFWFKYENELPKDVCFFDWQTPRCASVFTDLHYMLFLSLDAETRKKYHSDALDWYYSDLGEVLQKFSLDINDIYPKGAFKSDEKKFAPFGLALAVSYSFLVSTEPTNLPDVGDLLSGNADKILEQLMKATDNGKQNIKQITTDYVSYGYNM